MDYLMYNKLVHFAIIQKGVIKPMKIICEKKTRKRGVKLSDILFIVMIILLGILDYAVIKNFHIKDMPTEDTSSVELPPLDKEKILSDQIDTMQNQIDTLTAELKILREENNELKDQITEKTTEVMNTEDLYEPMAITAGYFQDINDETVSWNSYDNSITNITGMTVDECDLIIERILSNRDISLDNDISYCSTAIIQAEQQYGISATAILSIITWETGFDSDMYNWKNNVAGIKASDGSYRYFDSKNESILYTGELLRSYIDDFGLYSWTGIGERYCDQEWSQRIPETTNLYNQYLAEIRNLT